jgi:hypothetical protein
MAYFKPRMKKVAANRLDPLQIALMALLRDELPPTKSNEFGVHLFHSLAQKMWEEWGGHILDDWPNDGTMPQCWWLYDAPVKPDFVINHHPGAWALHPGLTPGVSLQRAYLKKYLPA